MSSIIGQIEQNIWSYFPLNSEKLLNLTLFTLYHLQIFTSQHQTWSKCMWHKISDEFYYESNRARTVRVICP